MAKPIGWQKQDPEFGKLKIEARFFGSSLGFFRQSGRFEPWEEFAPSDEDWETLADLSEKKLLRGKAQLKHLRLVRERKLR